MIETARAALAGEHRSWADYEVPSKCLYIEASGKGDYEGWDGTLDMSRRAQILLTTGVSEHTSCFSPQEELQSGSSNGSHFSINANWAEQRGSTPEIQYA